MTIKEYADLHGKSVQAVYKQMKSRENAKKLEGHILIRKVGNKEVQVLDEVAIAILEDASTQAPQVIVQMEDKEQIANLQEENKKLLLTLTEVQDALIKAKEQSLLAEQQKLLLEDRGKQIDKLQSECRYYQQQSDEYGVWLQEAQDKSKELKTELEEVKKMNVWQFMKYRKQNSTDSRNK